MKVQIGLNTYRQFVKKQLKTHKTWKVYLQVERMRWHLSDQITPIQIKIKRVIKK